MPELQVQSLGQEDLLEGNGNPLQYFCLGNLMDRGALWATFHGITKVLDTIEGLNNNNIFKVKYGPTYFNQ